MVEYERLALKVHIKNKGFQTNTAVFFCLFFFQISKIHIHIQHQ